ncbi:MAG TPA: YcaO-like family protein [Polyangiales bacterium]|nr:YcaO-like family protein [Polyangiales bacterium]
MLETPADETSAHRRLEELQASHGMPMACTLQEVFLQRVNVGDLQLCMVGLVASTPGSATVTGAAADESGFPVDRAYFELIERLSIFLARSSSSPLVIRDRAGTQKGSRTPSQVFPADKKPEVQRVSLSNGVALHTSWQRACDAAQAELIERDRVLRSFAGEYAPVLVPDADPQLAHSLRDDYEVSAYAFGPKRKQLKHVAAGLFLFPLRESAPLVYGFGADASAVSALASAKREALQRLAFLWGEPLPAEPPPPQPVPDYHQEYYLYPAHHAILRDWLAGKRRPAATKTDRTTKADETNSSFDAATSFVDLTIQGLAGALVVAKAIARGAAVLRFGLGSAASRAGAPPHPIA